MGSGSQGSGSSSAGSQRRDHLCERISSAARPQRPRTTTSTHRGRQHANPIRSLRTDDGEAAEREINPAPDQESHKRPPPQAHRGDMLPYARMLVSRAARGLALTLLAAALAVLCTYPIAFKLDSVGRLNTADGHWSLWCVTWVAHALAEDPRDLYNANIFYPHKNTLAYSEANIVPGLLGVPAYLITKSPYATHNSVVLMGFIFSFLTAYALAHYLTRHTAASILCGIAFAYCPFIFARTAHIQLLMTFGLPWAMHFMHRLIDRPNWLNAISLGLILVIQALACAYYGIFAGLTVGLGVLYYAYTRGLWKNRAYWGFVFVAAAISVAIVGPFFLPYITVQKELGFTRTIEDANMFSADIGAWLASSAHGHRWMLRYLEEWGGWNEVLFPGFLTTILGLAGIWVGLRARRNAAAPEVAISGRTREIDGVLHDRAGDFVLDVVRSAGGTLYAAVPHHSGVLVPARARARGHRGDDGAGRADGDRGERTVAPRGGAHDRRGSRWRRERCWR